MKHLNTALNLRQTMQSERAKPTQVKNNAGGYVFAASDMEIVKRFLILGTEGGTYYASESTLTKELASACISTIQSDGEAVVSTIVEISVAGRAAKNDYALFLLAAAAAVGNLQTRRAALNALPSVARTATHLFQFLEYTKQFRGWGRGLKTAVAGWYNAKEVNALAYQMVKYRNRNGWTHRDVLRKAHPNAVSEQHAALYDWACHGLLAETAVPSIVKEFALAIKASPSEAVILIQANKNLPWEVLSTEALASKEVWKALLPSLPMTALMRNLGRMTANGAITPFSAEEELVVQRLSNVDAIKRARLHPVSLFVAKQTYEKGCGDKGSLTWVPSGKIVAALENAFYKSFSTIEPTGKRFMVALDVSGSMSFPGGVAGIKNINAREASAIMALTTLKSEERCVTMAFSRGFIPLNLTANDNFASALAKVSGLPFDSTDCAQPMLYAAKHKIPVDCFIIYTDNETWSGRVHPFQALKDYRAQMQIPAKLAVVAMSGDKFSIADPSDSGMMDFVGFDTNTPQAISEFAKL